MTDKGKAERRGRAGFSMVELMITMLVVGLLAAIAVPIMRSYAKRAIASEGTSLVGSIRSAQRVWFAEHNAYTADWNDISGQVDIVNNRYFTTAPTLTASGTGATAAFTAAVSGSGEGAGVTVSIDESGTITTTGI